MIITTREVIISARCGKKLFVEVMCACLSSPSLLGYAQAVLTKASHAEAVTMSLTREVSPLTIAEVFYSLRGVAVGLSIGNGLRGRDLDHVRQS